MRYIIDRMSISARRGQARNSPAFSLPQGIPITDLVQVIWISNDLLAACALLDGIYLYQIRNSAPRLAAKIPFEIKLEKQIRCCRRHKRLFCQSEEGIRAFDACTGEEVYQITLSPKKFLGFDVLEDRLYVKKRSGEIWTYSAESGELLHRSRAKSKANLLERYMTRIGGFEIHNMSMADASVSVEYLSSEQSLYLFDSTAGKKQYLHPPLYRTSSRLLFGHRILLVVNSSEILAVDLADRAAVSHYRLNHIFSAFWTREDAEVSVITSGGLLRLPLTDFTPFPEDLRHCYLSGRSAFHSFENLASGYFALLGSTKSIFKQALHLDNKFAYDSFFVDLEYWVGDKFYRKDSVKISSIVEIANDGTTAAAFEAEETIVVYDSEDQPLFVIDRLHLSVNNSILKLCFSDNSRYLLVWRSACAEVFDAHTGKKAASVDLRNRPALEVRFSRGDTVLQLVLCDQGTYEIPLTHTGERFEKRPPSPR